MSCSVMSTSKETSNSRTSDGFYKQLYSASIGSFLTSIVVTPLDVVKTRLVYHFNFTFLNFILIHDINAKFSKFNSDGFREI